jgi:polysaccharide pyruvyl transferase WcaK-like protein
MALDPLIINRDDSPKRTRCSLSQFVATLRSAELLIASRLRGVILGFMSGTPAVAISSAAKVDSVMANFGQTDYLLQIRDFTSKDVLKALAGLELQRVAALQQISSHLDRALPAAASQYDTLARLAVGLKR